MGKKIRPVSTGQPHLDSRLRSFSTLISLVLVLISLFTAVGCVTNMPIEEWTLARAAYDAAKDADSARYVPAIWFDAEQNYREAQKAFKDRRYGDAQSLFDRSRALCETAENAARLARQQSGEVVP